MYGSKIASIRLARGYTQDYVAQKVGIDQRTYSKIEKDERIKMDEGLLEKIAATLGVSTEDIKSPTPIIMSFHNSPYSGQMINATDSNLIEALRQELKEKNEQINRLLLLLEKANS